MLDERVGAEADISQSENASVIRPPTLSMTEPMIGPATSPTAALVPTMSPAVARSMSRTLWR